MFRCDVHSSGLFQNNGLPVSARSEYETVATWGDNCPIHLTLFKKWGFPVGTCTTLTQIHRYLWCAERIYVWNTSHAHQWHLGSSRLCRGECYTLTFPTQIFPAGHRGQTSHHKLTSPTFLTSSTPEKKSGVEIKMAKKKWRNRNSQA